MTETRYDVVFDLSTADAIDDHTLTLPDGYITRIGMMHSGTSISSPGGVLMQAGYTTGSNHNGLIYRAANDHYYGPIGLLGLRSYAGEKIYAEAVRAADATTDSSGVPTLSIWIETDLSTPPPGLAQPIVDSDPPYFTTALSLSAPAAGADYTTISSSHTEYRVVAAHLPLSTDATAGYRVLRINGVQVLTVTGVGYADASSGGDFARMLVETPWARSITFDTENLAAGDQYSAGTLYVQERALL